MSDETKNEIPHRRYNPLSGEWVLCSPHRSKRPWQGQKEPSPAEKKPVHDPECYLCAGNQRIGGEFNPKYLDTYVFENDYRALLDNEVIEADEEHPLFTSDAVRGTCKVMCFSPNHSETIAKMSNERVQSVVKTWMRESESLGKRYKWVQVFENKGAAMGCSNPHPHGQIWAMSSVPTLPAKEDIQQKAYFEKNGRPMLLDYAEEELRRDKRIVEQNEDWLVVVPYWATWPFETLLIPRKRQILRLTDLSEPETASLASILKHNLVRYDNLFECDFPYSMGWHGAPFGEEGKHWQLHAHFYPPLLRSATVKKFMVGFEMLGEAQRDLTPEQAADRLRAMPPKRFQ